MTAMIHLDRNHPSPIAPSAKSNLILTDSNHADQHQILSWSAPARDDRPYYQDQAPFLPDKTIKRPAHPDAPLADAIPSSDPSSTINPITPGDTEDPKLPEKSPSSPADVPSPIAESTSSLTPPPDAVSPSAPVDAHPGDAPPAHVTEEGAGEASGKDHPASAEEVDKASRQSTPLSELSSAPDVDEVGESEVKAAEDKPTISSQGNPAANESARRTDGPQGNVTTHANPGAPVSLPSPSHDVVIATPPPPMQSTPSRSSFKQTSPTVDATHRSAASDKSAAALADSILSSSVPALARRPSTSSSQLGPTASHSSFDQKVVAILELNEHLLKISMKFQDRSIPMSDSRHNHYSARLQSNLTWLAAAADEGRKVPQVPLPMMQAPPAIEFGANERIQQLYSELPTLFAKDIRRRQQQTGTIPSTSPPHAIALNGKVKRDRTDEAIVITSSKRRDTGETKLPTPIAPAPPTPHLPAPQLPPHISPQASASLMGNVPTLHGGLAPSMSSPSMPPPSIPLGLVPGANDAQLAATAARERARQMQIRQALQQQQHAEGNRRMSPPTGMQQSTIQGQNIAGPSSMQLSQQQMAALSSLGPQAIQNYQLLQNPNHPIVQYLSQQMPGFSSLPIPQQLQSFQMAQMAFQARSQHQQQQRAAAQAQAGGSLQGFQQGGMSNFGAGGSGSSQIPTQGGSPTRVSPVSHSPMQGQSSSAAGFPYTSHGTNSTAGLDPRTMPQGLTQQQQAAFASLNPQQRQLFLMQQQQMMRGGNGSNSMINPQAVAAAQERMRQEQQQRMAQASLAHQSGSPMPGGADGGQFSGLRTNPGIPGIARSARTPSDSAPSPVNPQRLAGQTSEDFQRAMLMQQAQRGMANQSAGFSQMNWSQGQQQAQNTQGGHGQGAYGMSPPNSAGAGGFGGMPMSAGSQNWSQGTGAGQFPFSASSPTASQHHSDAGMTPRQASSTPVPQLHQQMPQNSPAANQAGLNDLDIFNW
ncbi:hypothetical protein B0H21DRAFT_27595 [Amylocystis lapponica]|nr:hypothetical protein B0H21DRAFT_27595 [Amylocystis lapponica]